MSLTKQNIFEYAKRYDYAAKPSDKGIEEKFKTLLKRQRFLTRDNLVEVGIWKSPRPKEQYAANGDLAVRELTEFSFSAKSEQAKMGALLVLKGVSYPLASVILHFAFPDEYPILDFRALWSLGWEQPSSYTFEFWEKYCMKVREISKGLNLSIRTIDKALWQYSKEHQGKK